MAADYGREFEVATGGGNGRRCTASNNVYLFDQSTSRRLSGSGGVDVLSRRPLRNSDTLDCALKMFLLPALLKSAMISALRTDREMGAR
jgi:hypothetical protein